MTYFRASNCAIRYRGFLLIEQQNKSWLIRPERSPLVLLPFRTEICSLIEAKLILDAKLDEKKEKLKAA
ncbi:hypothetical protein [Prochlorococcus marinus]|nr:hypothetical protein [Prochlorococcus marinus]